MSAGSLLLLAMTQPAFRAFFIGEDFVYLGQYRAYGNDFWRAVLSPVDGIFFRPVFCAIRLLWHFVLPLDPSVHHTRNLVFSVLNLILLHRLLVWLVASRAARVLALGLFTLSKVHLTTIGYIDIYDSILLLMLTLMTALFFVRYIARRRLLDYGLGLLCCGLCIFSKDYGLVVVGVVVALIASRLGPDEWRTGGRQWALRLVPPLALALAYLGVRYAVVGTLPLSNPSYTPRLSLDVIALKTVLFTSTLGNLSVPTGYLSLADQQESGAGGLGDWLVLTHPELGAPAGWVEPTLYLAFVALVLGTLMARCRTGRALLFPLAWVVAYLGPTLLVRNVQPYYMYESLAGTAVLLGISLDRAGRRLLATWGVALVLVGVNGALSNYTSSYHWQAAADAAGRIREPVLEAYRDRPLESLTFVTRAQRFWQWTLTAGSQGPMIPELMGRPGLRVRFIDYNTVRNRETEANDANPFLDIDNSFAPFPFGYTRPVLFLRQLMPSQGELMAGFNVQPGGQWALAVTAENATPGTMVVLDETRLATTYGNPGFLTALVPPELLARPGDHWLFLTNDMNESNRLKFAVTVDGQDLSGVAPTGDGSVGAMGSSLRARQLHPAATTVGKGFNIQPDGRSALSVESENARPDTIVVFSDTPLETDYASDRSLSAIVPAALYDRPGRYEVYLKYGSSESNRVDFEVLP